jgi:acetyl esterase
VTLTKRENHHPMLHPRARSLLELMDKGTLPETHTLTPRDARAFYLERRAITQPAAPEVALVRELATGGTEHPVPLRLYRPLGSRADALLPVLLYFHGGGWTMGDLDTHDVLCRQLANGAGCALVAVDYRLGPEHRFPAAVDDCVAATRWVHGNAAALGLDAQRLAVGGDSAGGNLAAVVAIAERDAAASAAARIRFQLLIYPATDMRRGAPSHRQLGQGYLLTQDTLAYFHDHYIDDAAHDLDWRASPLLHPDLRKLPPALVLTAGYDPLRDEGLAYAQRLSEAGVRATHLCFERQIHGFITMGRVIDEANEAVAVCADALRRALGA